MSKTRTIKRAAAAAITNADNSRRALPRPPFSITITFDPARPQTANVNVMPVGGDGQGGAYIDDVVTALRMAYEQALLQKGAWLQQQQMQAQSGNGAQEGSAPA